MTAHDIFSMPHLSTRSRLIVLVLFAALPALVLITYNIWDAYMKAEAHARENLQSLVKVLGSGLASNHHVVA
jgi:RsiW-degrading membrane proteinase PrsW (M82 family)